MLGEIRDAATASLAVQAALSGHRLICTMHAANPGGAIARLLEMGLEPYRITSALYGVIAQRLLRKLSGEGPQKYRGRIPAAEFVGMSGACATEFSPSAMPTQLQSLAVAGNDHSSLRDSAHSLVAQHLTDIAGGRARPWP